MELELELELELPDSIIQHVQSFLPEEDAFRSCTLSKAWLRSYSTLPVLKFVQTRFRGDNDKFVRIVNDTLVRYRLHNLRIQSLELFLEQSPCPKNNINIIVIINIWLDVALQYCGLANLTLEFIGFNEDFEFPLKIFNAKTLRELRIVNCRLESEKGLQLPIVVSSSLVTLELNYVVMTEPVLNHLLSNCWSIETLVLYMCPGLKNVTIGGTNLKHLKQFRFTPIEYPAEVQLSRIPSIPYDICAKAMRIPSTFRFDSSGNLTYLELSSINITCMFQPQLLINTSMFLPELLINVPFLTSLVFNGCNISGYLDVQHDLLKSLKIYSCYSLRQVNIACPKLEFLTYCGVLRLPTISLAKSVVNLAELKTTIDLGCTQVLDNSWFLCLYGILGNLNHCHQLSIDLKWCSKVNVCSYCFGVIPLPWLPIVENVYLDIPQNLMSTICQIKDAIHYICYPMNIMVREVTVE